LFIAPSTVKVHIFTKLGIATRAELAGQAATRPDDPQLTLSAARAAPAGLSRSW
jgi:DNA-binding NarL/FixJ family response regulator